MSGMVDPNGERDGLYFGQIDSLKASRSLALSDNGRVLRSDSASNITISVLSTFPEGYVVGFSMWGAGTMTISGATNRSGKTALSTQYQSGWLVVVKNSDGASAEFVLSGDFA